MRNLPMMRRFAIWGDDLMGYGKPEPAFKWWFDLEDVDGEIRVPPKSLGVDFYEAEKDGAPRLMLPTKGRKSGEIVYSENA